MEIPSEEEQDKGPTPVTPGSLRWLVQAYYCAPAFTDLHVSTRAKRRAILDGICIKHGTRPFARMESQHVELKIRDPKRATPEAANGRVKALRQVFKWAVRVKYASTNPARDVPMLRPNNPDGHHTWTVEEIEQYLAHHGPGSTARKTMYIFLCTGVRISDAVKLGPVHERQVEGETRLVFTEENGKLRNPKHRDIRLLPKLQAELDASQSGHLVYLVTKWGKPYSTARSFGNLFKRWCKQTGLPHCAAHGIRKAATTFAAEDGATAHELMAMFGWTTLKQAAGYTRKANERKLADSGMNHMDRDYTANKSVPLSETVEASGTLRGKKAC